MTWAELCVVLIVGAVGAWVAFAWGRFRRTVLHELRTIRRLLERWTNRGE